jgi:hypothetical protein
VFPILSHRRIEHVLVRDPVEVPDLVAAAVMGACRYLPVPASVLVPFLGRARADGAGRPLSDRLADVTSASVALWPPAPGEDGGGAPAVAGEGWSTAAPEPAGDPDPDESMDDAPSDSPGPSFAPAPDAVVTLHREGGPPAWVVIEAVGLDGRLSGIDGLDDPGLRLAGHWAAARRSAGREGVPLAIVLVTTGSSVPESLFAQARDAIRRAGQPPAPLYGLSWRAFATVARAVGAPPLVLSDLLDLLEGAWGLVEVQWAPWPAPPPPAPSPRFAATVRWPQPPRALPALPAGPDGGFQ